MANANVKEFTDSNFQSEVLDSKVPVLVDFWAEWCMPCKMLTPTIESLAEEFAGKIKVGKFDIDSNQQTPFKYQINAIPTVIIFKGGQVAKKFIGLTNKSEFVSALQTAAA